jgi:hypothetical protein
MTKYFEPPFPLLEDTIKQTEKQIDEALWNDDHLLVDKLRKTIDSIKLKISFGEQYHIPF